MSQSDDKRPSADSDVLDTDREGASGEVPEGAELSAAPPPGSVPAPPSSSAPPAPSDADPSEARTPAAAPRPADAPSADPRIGRTLVGRYRLERPIGRGGMGRVYLATQHPLNRSVAVKILNPDFQQKDPQFVRRFFLEAATAARLNHPNTITIFDYGETDEGELFIAMEYLKGRPLSRLIAADKFLDAERSLDISMQIVRALREAHTKGIIHRDLKPGNIMLLDEGDDPNFAKVLDFGLVKLFTPEGSGSQAILDQLTPSPVDDDLTQAGMFLGSPKYMSPEQIQGKELDPRTDIYSLGVIMFQMLAGRVPFRGGNSVEIIYKHVHAPVPAIHDLNPEADAPPELEHLVHRCLSKDREGRFASMADLLLELKKVRRALVGSQSVSGSLDSLGVGLAGYPSVDISASFPPSNPLSSGTGEVPFADPGADLDDTPGGHPLIDVSYANRRMLGAALLVRVVPAVAALGLVAGLGYFAYLMSSSQVGEGTKTSAPVEGTQAGGGTDLQPIPIRPVADDPTELSADRVQTRLILDSKPQAARVELDGKPVGRTPLEWKVERGPEDPDVVVVTFELDGYREHRLEQQLDGGSTRIFAALEPLPDGPDAAEPALTDKKPVRNSKKPPRRGKKPKEPRKVPSDYKANPY